MVQNGYRGLKTHHSVQSVNLFLGIKKRKRSDVVESKACTVCGEIKTLDKFTKDKGYIDGYRHQCKTCNNKKAKENRYKRRDRLQNSGYNKIETKCCSTCTEIKEISNFYKESSSKDGYGNLCKSCRAIYTSEYNNKNKQKNKNGQSIVVDLKRCSLCLIVYPISNFDTHCYSKDGHNCWCKSCSSKKGKEYRNTPEAKEKIKEYHEEYLKNPENWNMKKEAMAQWVKRNCEYVKTKRKEYIATHREEIREMHRKYDKTPNGKNIAARKNHRRRLRNNEVECTLTLEQWEKIIADQKNKCVICDKPFNTKRKATRDHIIPLSKGGGLTFENVQALCKSCNSKKHNSLDKQNIVTWFHPHPTS